MKTSYFQSTKKNKLSLLMITKNAEKIIENTLNSVSDLVDEIVAVDNSSTDQTVAILKKYKASIYSYKGNNLGEQRRIGLEKCTGEWVLVLDSDEVVSDELRDEIRRLLKEDGRKSTIEKGYYIPFQNYFLGRPLHYGGEDYKMLRLFRKDAVTISSDLVHEGFIYKSKVKSEKFKVDVLKGVIYHYSYRSLGQMYKKFTDYAIREAQQKKSRGEHTSLWKIVTYPPHMFWARFIKDKGYKDGLFRIPLDLGFAWMELVTYIYMLFI